MALFGCFNVAGVFLLAEAGVAFTVDVLVLTALVLLANVSFSDLKTAFGEDGFDATGLAVFLEVGFSIIFAADFATDDFAIVFAVTALVLGASLTLTDALLGFFAVLILLEFLFELME